MKPFKIGLKNIRSLRINLTKDVHILYPEDNKILLREVKDLNKWRVLAYSWIRKTNITRCQFNQMNRSMSFQSNSYQVYFPKISKCDFKIDLESEGQRIAKITLNNKSKVGRFTLLALRLTIGAPGWHSC